ncbi:MAG TPA: TonB-dependent receptor [Terriglobales bacterium]|nr:TonB-dependent receptor [Terriglobales bacterium]
MSRSISRTYAALDRSPASGIWRTRFRTAFRLLTLLALIATAIAQQGAKDLSEASLEELTNIQVYSASKHMQSASEAPASVTVVTADEIQKYGYRNLADILRSVPGFYVTYDRDYTFVGVRGFGRLGDWNSRILVLIDGHRINNNVLGQAMLGNEFLVDVDMIERVEIVFGPSSSLYGANAFFAVINVITRTVKDVKDWELSFQTGSFGTNEGRATYGHQFHDLGVLLSGTFYDSQGQTLFFPQFNSPATDHGITSDTDYESYKHILATLTFHGFTLQGLFATRDKGVPTAYFGAIFNDPAAYNVDSHQYVSLDYQHSIGKWQLDADTSYDQARLQGPVPEAPLMAGEPVVLNTYSFRGNWWTGEAKVSRDLFERNHLTLGTEIRDNLRQDQGDLANPPNVFTPEPNSSLITAVYAQDEFGITSRITLNAGVRYDHYSTFGGTLNPRAAVIYRPAEKTALKLLYGNAFSAPDVYETSPNFGAFYDDNFKLKPERIQSLEARVEQALGQYFQLSSGVYRNRISDLITLVQVPADQAFQYQNDGSAQATGVDVALSGRATNGLQGKASFDYVDAHNDNAGHPALDNSPGPMAKLNLIVPLIGQRLSAGVEGQFLGRRLTLLQNSLSSYQVFNLTLLGHTVGKHLDVAASVFNLLDKKYFDPGRPEDPEDAIQQDGRSVRIKITGRF